MTKPDYQPKTHSNSHPHSVAKEVEFKRHLETRVIHGGQAPEPATGAR